MFRRYVHRRGITAVEAVIGLSIAGLMLTYAAHAIVTFISSARAVTEKTQALYLAEDGLELLRFVRDNDWSNVSGLSLGTPHYLDVASTYVRATTTPETIGDFSRSFTLRNVYRNSSTDDIVASTTSGAVADPDSKYVTMTVSWDGGTESVALTGILADLEP